MLLSKWLVWTCVGLFLLPWFILLLWAIVTMRRK